MNQKTSHINHFTMKNIVLIGFMGCGKSTVGWQLHKYLGYPFLDTDQEIEKQSGSKISTIFKNSGEASFRKMETALLQNLINQKTHRTIIATGGGIVTTPENISLLQNLGFVVWLTCSEEIILKRTSRTNHRPLLQCENPKKVIVSLLKKRNPLYKSAAHLEINTSNLSIPEINYGILESARYHFSRNET